MYSHSYFISTGCDDISCPQPEVQLKLKVKIGGWSVRARDGKTRCSEEVCLVLISGEISAPAGTEGGTGRDALA